MTAFLDSVFLGSKSKTNVKILDRNTCSVQLQSIILHLESVCFCGKTLSMFIISLVRVKVFKSGTMSKSINTMNSDEHQQGK